MNETGNSGKVHGESPAQRSGSSGGAPGSRAPVRGRRPDRPSKNKADGQRHGKGRGRSGERREESQGKEGTQAKIHELMQRSGLPHGLAREVMEGTCTLNQALHRLMRREKAERLVRQHGFSLSAAFSVASGHTTVEDQLVLQGLSHCEARQPDRSVLVDLRTSGGEGLFFVFGEEPFTARVSAVERYDVVLDVEGGSEGRRIQKHDIKFVSPDLLREDLDRLLSEEPSLLDQGLGSSKNYRDRFRSSKKVLFKHHRDRLPTRVVLRDGTVLTGFVGWFGKWEFELALLDPRKKHQAKAKPSGSVVIFRHALHSLQAL